MKKISLALIILIIVGICIPAVSAATYELSDGDSLDRYYRIVQNSGYTQGSGGVYFVIPDMANFQGVTRLVQIIPADGMPLQGETSYPDYTSGSTTLILYDTGTSTPFASGIFSWSANYKGTESIQEWIFVG